MVLLQVTFKRCSLHKSGLMTREARIDLEAERLALTLVIHYLVHGLHHANEEGE